jgi:hypothetical protein
MWKLGMPQKPTRLHQTPSKNPKNKETKQKREMPRVLSTRSRSGRKCTELEEKLTGTI